MAEVLVVLVSLQSIAEFVPCICPRQFFTCCQKLSYTSIYTGCRNCPEFIGAISKFWRQKDDVKKFHPEGPEILGHHCTKFSRHCDRPPPPPGIVYTRIYVHNFKYCQYINQKPFQTWKYVKYSFFYSVVVLIEVINRNRRWRNGLWNCG
jgi:hypothetical protein